MKTDYEKFVKGELKEFEDNLEKFKNNKCDTLILPKGDIYFVTDDSSILTDIEKWYLFTMHFLDDPKNSKYVALLIFIFKKHNSLSIKKECKDFYKFCKEKKSLRYVIEGIGISSFKYDSKVYHLLKELVNRLILCKNDMNYIINPMLLNRDLSLNRVFPEIQQNELSPQYLYSSKEFDLDFVKEIYDIISDLNLSRWKPIACLYKFNFNSFYLTWYKYVENITCFNNILNNFPKEEQDKNIEKVMRESFIDFPEIDWKKKDNYVTINDKSKIKIKNIDYTKLRRYLDFIKDSIKNNVEISNCIFHF